MSGMSSESRERISGLYHAALAYPAKERRADGYQFRPYDVTRDGQRFLVPTMRPSDNFRVVLNWRTLLPK
jgi:hypothetical protein